MAGVGVYQGDFATAVLKEVEGVARYCMIDRWRHLDGRQFAFVGLTGHYTEIGLRHEFAPQNLLRLMAKGRFPGLARAVRKMREVLSRS